MIDKRLLLALAPGALLAACDAGTDESTSASSEVVEGTISDAMLPIDRVRSEPPLEDPEAFAEAQESATASRPPANGGVPEPADGAEGDAGEEDASGAQDPQPPADNPDSSD